jgi:hypothetical protein
VEIKSLSNALLLRIEEVQLSLTVINVTSKEEISSVWHVQQENTFIQLLLSVITHQLLHAKLVPLPTVDSVQVTSAKDVRILTGKTWLLELWSVLLVMHKME